MNPVLQAIADRRSIRKYEDRAIDAQTLEALLEAAFQAPSARNSQPWHLTLLTDPDAIQSLSDDGIALLSSMSPEPLPYTHLFHHAPCVIAIANDAQNDWSPVDVGIMSQTIALAAQSLGLGSCIIGLIKPLFHPDVNPAAKDAEAKYYARFGVPEGYRIGLAVALGYPTKVPEARPRAVKLTRV